MAKRQPKITRVLARNQLPGKPEDVPSHGQVRAYLTIHRELQPTATNGRRVSLQRLRAALEVSDATVYRYLARLKAPPYNLPIENDPSAGYFYSEKVDRIPLGANLSNGELVALEVARQALAVFDGTDFADSLKSSFAKVTSGMVSSKTLGGGVPIEELVSWRTPGAGISNAGVFGTVLEALLSGKALRVDYQGRGKHSPSKKVLWPYHLGCLENRWILVAKDVAVKRASESPIRTYVVARIQSAKVLRKPVTRPINFAHEHYLSGALGAHGGGPDAPKIEARIRIGAIGAHHVLERKWHPSQATTVLPGGDVEVRFILTHTGDLMRWVLAFGADCEVLEPHSLRAELATEAAKMGSLYASK